MYGADSASSLFEYGLTTGGPGVMSVGWIVVSFFSMYCTAIPRKASTNAVSIALFVGLGMAEIVSAVPTSGGPYFWAAMLAPEKNAAFASWITGWLD